MITIVSKLLFIRIILPPYSLSTTHSGSDGFGSLSISQSVVGVLVGGGGRRHGGYHDAAAVTPQRVLEEACKLAIAIWDMSVAICQGIDAISWKK